MFAPADRVIALGIYCRYCILRRRVLTELVSEATVLAKSQPPRIDLPKGWTRCVESAGIQASRIEGPLPTSKPLSSDLARFRTIEHWKLHSGELVLLTFPRTIGERRLPLAC